jgi:hypothetical protein
VAELAYAPDQESGGRKTVQKHTLPLAFLVSPKMAMRARKNQTIFVWQICVNSVHCLYCTII